MSNNPCDPAQPFVKLGNGSNAPTLDYNLPQETCYDIYLSFKVNIPAEFFKEECFVVPEGNLWEKIQGMTLQTLVAELKEDLLMESYTYFINGFLLTRYKDAIKILATTDTIGAAAGIASSGILQSRTISGMAIAKDAEGGRIRLSPEASQALTGSFGSGSSSAKDTKEFIRDNFVGMETPRIRPEFIGRALRIHHKTAIPQVKETQIQIAGFTLDFIATQLKNGYLVELYVDFNGKLNIRFIKRPAQPSPAIHIVEHQKMCSYLGNYGAGKVLHTMSLLPGEKTTISVKTYKDEKKSYHKESIVTNTEVVSSYYSDDESSTRSKSENILDSYSQTSANQFEKKLESLMQSNSLDEANSSANSSFAMGGSVSGGVGIGPVDLKFEGGFSASTNSTTTSNMKREEVVSNVNSALESSVAESSSSRDIEVNNTTSNTTNRSTGGKNEFTASTQFSSGESVVIGAGEESLTLRSLENINYSRTLNFTFRQLVQEYITLIYLNNATVTYSNGYPQTQSTSTLSTLIDFVKKFIKPDHVENVIKAIRLHLCNVRNYQGLNQPLIEYVSENWTDCKTGLPDATYEYYRKKAGLSQTIEIGSLTISVPGIILSVASNILRTDSVIADALLGQGEALDCYNNRLQNIEVEMEDAKLERYQQENITLNQKNQKENDKLQEAIATLQAITDPVERSEAFKRMFVECCTEDLMLMMGKICNPPAISS